MDWTQNWIQKTIFTIMCVSLWAKNFLFFLSVYKFYIRHFVNVSKKTENGVNNKPYNMLVKQLATQRWPIFFF